MNLEVWIYQNPPETNTCTTLMHFMGVITGGKIWVIQIDLANDHNHQWGKKHEVHAAGGGHAYD